MSGKTIRFNGKGQPGNLLDPHNWAGGVVPGIGDTALIATNVGGPVNGAFSVNNMMLLGTEKIVFQGILNTVGVGACKGLMVCDGATAVFAPGAVLNDGNVMIVGNDGNGTLNVTHGGVVNIGTNLDVGACKGGLGQVAVANGSIAVSGSLHIGGAAATAGSGTFSVGAGGVVTVAGDLGVGATGTLNLAGGSVTDGSIAGGTASHIAVQAGGIIAGFGSISATNGAQIWDQGIIQATGGTLTVNGNIAGNGSLGIGANSTAVINASTLKLAGISFLGPNADLTLAHGSAINAPISGFAIGDILSMASVDAVSFNASTGVLTLSEHSAFVENLHFVGNFSGEMFTIHQQNGMGAISLQHS